jgi:hypothetical protein
LSSAPQPRETVEFIEKELARALVQAIDGGQGVLAILCQGYLDELRLSPSALADENLRQKIYRAAVQYLFRLLLLFYADSRGLLRSENHKTLENIREQIDSIQSSPATDQNDYATWTQLGTLFTDIEQSIPGGLFGETGSESAQLVAETRLKIEHLGIILFQLLTYRQPDGWRCVVNYQDMNVRHLGTLYESLLGQKLLVSKNGALQIGSDSSERKSSGSYYTPEYIIQYLLTKTLGERLNALKAEFLSQEAGSLQTLANAAKPGLRVKISRQVEEKALRWIRDRILSISVLDPAMGSGHFLVSAADFIANFISEFLNDLGVEGQAPSSPAYWRRQVVEHCLYGMDLDPLAVQLAKASLWMISMDKDQPPASLNDHLRCANALTDNDIRTLGGEAGFDVIIGNPPWGADLASSRNHLKQHYQTNSNDSASYFLERAVTLTQGELAFIVPKSIAFYNGWKSIREFLLREMQLTHVLDAGIAFPNVNLESVALVLTKRQTGSPDPEIYHALPIKKFADPKTIQFQGRFDAKIMKISGIIPLIGLSAMEAQILAKLHQNSVKISDVAAEIYRGLYVPDAEKARLNPGQYAFINKVPDVKRYHIEKTRQVDLSGHTQWQAKIQKIMQPRLFFKVLRGRRLVCYPDLKGEYLTTEKLVNLVIDPAKYPAPYEFIAGVLNAALPSFYLQRVLFSKTTETSRVMDEPYLGHVILPRLKDGEEHQSLMMQVAENVRQLIRLSTEIRQTVPEKISETQREITRHEMEIEQAVNHLFGLSNEESQFLQEMEKKAIGELDNA